MNKFYKSVALISFKDGISVPGLILKYLFMISPDANLCCLMKRIKVFTSFSKQTKGAALLLLPQSGQDQNKMCKKVAGYDVNTLCLWAIM